MKIVPTVLATTPEEFAARLDVADGLSTRIHIDVADGTLTPGKTIGVAQMYQPDQPRDLDFHLMTERPSEMLDSVLSLQPDMVIFHAEANDALPTLVQRLHAMGVRAGLAILPDTAVAELDKDVIRSLDHALVFTGTLGQNGGLFNAKPLSKVAELRTIAPTIEVSVDGGVTSAVLPQLKAAGVDVAYVGAAIHAAGDPTAAYVSLTEAAA